MALDASSVLGYGSLFVAIADTIKGCQDRQDYTCGYFFLFAVMALDASSVLGYGSLFVAIADTIKGYHDRQDYTCGYVFSFCCDCGLCTVQITYPYLICLIVMIMILL